MEINKLIFTVLFSSGILFGVVFVWYTRFFKQRKDRTNNYLTWFLVIFTLNNIQILWVDNFVSQTNCYLKNLHPFLFFVFVVPLFHSFIASYLKIEDKVFSYLKVAKVLFFLGMVARIVLLPIFKVGNCTVIGQYVQSEEIVIALLSLFVFLQVVRIVYFKKHLFIELLSYDKLQWITQFLILGGIVLGFWIFAIVFNFKNYVNPQFFIYYPLRISSSVLLYWVGYTGSFQNFVTTERVEIRAKIQVSPLLEPQNTPEFSQKFNDICKYIEISNCFLNADYTLEQLANDVSLGKNNLSSEINNNTRGNFNDFLNSYRVEKAKQLLKNPNYDHYTIDSIGLECGFNSKSTFYAAFKKVTNTTPAMYRKILF